MFIDRIKNQRVFRFSFFVQKITKLYKFYALHCTRRNICYYSLHTNFDGDK
jgi:hypothetical protein